MIKILHTADIHLDSPLRSLALRDKNLQSQVQAATRNVFRKIVDLALAEDVAALLLAGDIFDGKQRSAQTMAFFTAQLDRLGKAAIPVFCIKGNHDAENPLVSAFEPPQNMTVFRGRDKPVKLALKQAFPREIYIHGVSFSGRQEPESLLPRFSAPVPHMLNIGLLHSSLNGAAGHDVYAPCSVAELAAFGYDYWALGHIHKRQVYREKHSLIVMPGTPQGRDIGEDGAKSITMLCLDKDGGTEAAEYIIADIGFYRQKAAMDGIEDGEAARAAVAEALRQARADAKTEKAAVRLILTGKTPLHWQFIRDYDHWQKLAAELAQNFGSLWLDKLELRTEDSAAAQAQAEADILPVEELERLMAESAQNPALQEECKKILANLRKQLPHSVRAAVFKDNKQAEQALTEKLLAEGRQIITAVLESAGQAETANGEEA